MTPEEKAKAYDELFAKAKQIYNKENDVLIMHTIETLFPELKESEDEKVRKELIKHLKEDAESYEPAGDSSDYKRWLVWLEKQGEKHPDPYNGISFEYNGHIWGMCARDNGVDILCDKHLIKHLEEQGEKLPVGFYYVNSEGKKFYSDTFKYGNVTLHIEKQGEKDILPRYSIGDVLCDKSCTTLNKESQPNFEITDIRNGMYICDKCSFPISQQDEYELVAKRIEQKPADKVEPKFKVGDWLINPRTSHIIHIKDALICGNKGIYELENSSMSIENIEDNFRLWTIQDVKDGDVLVTRKKQPFIFKNYDENTDYIYAYCGICDLVKDNSFYADDDQLWTCYSVVGDVYPATKEQRNALMKAMADAGYTFDFEKKELKRIKQKPAEDSAKVSESSTEEKNMDEYKKGFECGKQRVLKYPEDFGLCKKSAWSKDDEAKRNALISLVEEIKNQPLKRLEDWDGYINWLQSLKDGVQSTKQEWNEEEIEKAAQEWDSKANFNPFYMTMEGDKPTGVKQHITTHKESFKAGVNWILKSLKRWKPSDEQMEALWCNCSDGSVLISLYNDLKKLKDS